MAVFSFWVFRASQNCKWFYHHPRSKICLTPLRPGESGWKMLEGFRALATIPKDLKSNFGFPSREWIKRSLFNYAWLITSHSETGGRVRRKSSIPLTVYMDLISHWVRFNFTRPSPPFMLVLRAGALHQLTLERVDAAPFTLVGFFFAGETRDDEKRIARRVEKVCIILKGDQVWWERVKRCKVTKFDLRVLFCT